MKISLSNTSNEILPVVQVNGHFVAAGGRLFCDTFGKGNIGYTDDAPRRRMHVRRQLVVPGRSEELADILRKNRSAGQVNANHTSIPMSGAKL